MAACSTGLWPGGRPVVAVRRAQRGDEHEVRRMSTVLRLMAACEDTAGLAALRGRLQREAFSRSPR
eukprot:6695513-Pyramimonas_sp.AAC.1